MFKTNGLECSFQASSGWVYIYNHATNDMGCLRMPATNLFRIALLDKEGHQVKKTALGEMYGMPLSQGQIDEWFHHWRLFHQSKFIQFFPNGIDKYDMPTAICNINLKDAFEIKEPGEYEFHLQMRLIQVGKDHSGNLHYPVAWLPEVTAKIEIRSGDPVK